MPITTNTAAMVIAGELFFLGGVRVAGVSAFLFLRLSAFLFLDFYEPLRQVPKWKSGYTGAGPSALAKSRFSPMVVTHILIYSSIL